MVIFKRGCQELYQPIGLLSEIQWDDEALFLRLRSPVKSKDIGQRLKEMHAALGELLIYFDCQDDEYGTYIVNSLAE